MKKISKIIGIITCAFVLAISGTLLTACGGANPYSIKGATLNGSDKCIIIWEVDATQQDKEALWGDFNATNDEEFVQKYLEEVGEAYKSLKYAFNDDGTVCVQNIDGEKTMYYTQSENLEVIRIYKDVAHTNGYAIIEYFNGEYCVAGHTDYNAIIYLTLEKA